MRRPATPELDPRDAAAIIQELLARRPAYLPEWNPRSGSASAALLQSFGRMAQAVIERLNHAPDKNLLAFLDMLGISLIPAQSARAPVVFEVIPDSQDGRAPAGTRLGSPGNTTDASPIIFETERSIALASARIVAVVSVSPNQDAYADHSLAVGASQPYTLFSGLQLIPHELYIAHDTLCALTDTSRLEVTFELSPGEETAPLDIAWEFWDGDRWQAFAGAGTQDGTEGMNHPGVVTLIPCCGQSTKTTVNGISAHWIRGRLTSPLLPQSTGTIPQIERIRLRSVIERPIREDSIIGVQSKKTNGVWTHTSVKGGVSDLQPDQILADGRQVDVTRSFMPLGLVPRAGAALYVACEEAFSKPGANVRVCFHRLITPEEEIDEEGKQYQIDIKDVRENLIDAAKIAVDTVQQAAKSVSLNSNDQIVVDQALQLMELAYINLDNKNSADSFVKRVKDLSEKVGHVRDALTKAPPVYAFYGWYPPPQVKTDATTTIDNSKSLVDKLADLAQSAPSEVSPPQLAWEYWNGSRWETLFPPGEGKPENFLASSNGSIKFRVPSNWEPMEVSGAKKRWMRIRLAGGSYDKVRVISWDDKKADFTKYLPIIEHRAPTLESFFLAYSYTSPSVAPEHCLTYNDFQYSDHTDDATGMGMPFHPYNPIADRIPAVYFGFDKPLPTDMVSLYLDTDEQADHPAGPPLVWELWDGQAWRELTVYDETAQLTRPGMLAFIAQPGSALARFGTPHHWVRTRLKEPGTFLTTCVNGLYLNATWAVQQQTINDEILGSSAELSEQVFFTRHTPMLPGERIEVRELSGSRAEVELPILREELKRQGYNLEDIRTVTDRRTGRISEVWVCWQERPHLYFSSPDDRHYVVEHARGRVIFGDGTRGKIPPAGTNNVLIRRYQTGGGTSGNVPIGAITQLLSLAAPAMAVTNPRAAEGGADGEIVEAARWRGPQDMRHRWCAVAAQDYEALAREASPGVAVAQARPTSRPDAPYVPGWVTVVIVPQSNDPRPQPTLQLRRRVQHYLAARAPASVTGIAIVGPVYLPVGVEVTIVPRDADQAGLVEQRVRAALERFLHPITGGPDGQGWPFGCDICVSHIAAALESLDDVDHVRELCLLLHGSPQGEQVPVPADQMVAAGPIRIRIAAGSEG